MTRSADKGLYFKKKLNSVAYKLNNHTLKLLHYITFIFKSNKLELCGKWQMRLTLIKIVSPSFRF